MKFYRTLENEKSMINSGTLPFNKEVELSTVDSIPLIFLIVHLVEVGDLMNFSVAVHEAITMYHYGVKVLGLV